MIAFLTTVFVAVSIGQGPAEFEALLREHYVASSTAQRKAVEKKILAVEGLTYQALTDAIRKLQLWEKRPTGEQATTVRLRRGASSERQLSLHVPSQYDPAKKWPLIITLHGQGGEAQGMLRLTRQVLGNRADEFIIAAPQDLGPLGFTEPSEVVSQPRQLLNALRKLYHIDSDRVIVIGYSLGAQNTWMSAIMHSDCFAAALPMATPLQVVGYGLVYPELLPNLQHVPVLFVWGQDDTIGPDGKPHPQGGNAALNRQLSAVAGAVGLKQFAPVEIAGVGHGGVVPPPEPLSKLLDQKRVRYPRRIRQVFRLPDQSPAYWVAAEGLQGEPLGGGVLKVPVKPGEDQQAAHRNYIVGHLGLIEARCKGQTITLNTRKCTYVDLLLSDALLDLDKPVKIIRNKKTVYEGKVPRDLVVTLRESVKGWDFERLPCARVVVPVAGKVRFGYLAAPKRGTAPKKK